MARGLHSVAAMRWMLTGAVLLAASTAHADCPTNLPDLPPTGFLASETRRVVEDYTGQPQPRPPRFEGSLGVAAGVRSELDGDASAVGTGSVSAQALARARGFTGCASGDLVDAHDGATHLTASAQVPFFFTGLGFGVAVDRRIRLPLATRPEFLLAPIDRAVFQLGVAFIDLELAEQADRLRIMVMPLIAEWSSATQTLDDLALARRRMRVATSMFRFASSSPTGTGHLGVADIAVETIVDPAMPEHALLSIARISPASLTSEGEHWSVALDGGVLSLYEDGVDCEHAHCNRGFYDGMVRYKLGRSALEARAARTGFLDAEARVALEDRGSLGYTLTGETRAFSATGFAARTRRWLEPGWTAGGGGRVGFSQGLGHDLSALVDAELVRTDATAARALISLAWQRSLKR